MSVKVAAIVPAAGAGKRLGAKIPKAFVPAAGKPLIVRTLLNLRRSFGFGEIWVAVSPAWLGKARKILDRHGLGGTKLIAGGRSRAESVWKALERVSAKHDWVLVHDAARPLVGAGLVRRILQGARRTGGAICAQPAVATVKRIDPKSGVVLGTEDRRRLYFAQTPQVFRRSLLLARYKRLGKKAFSATDEASLFDGTTVRVRIVEGEERNLKVTTPEHMKLLKYYLRNGS